MRSPDAGQDLPGRLIPGLKPQDRFKVSRGLIAASWYLEHRDSQVKMGRGIIRLQAQGRFILGDRLRRPAFDMEGISKIVVRLGQIGFQAQRRFIVGDRFLRPALGVEAQGGKLPRLARAMGDRPEVEPVSAGWRGWGHGRDGEWGV